MNTKRSFTKLRGNAPQNNPVISFRFHKHDEEMEEVSYEKKDSTYAPAPESSSKYPPSENDKALSGSVVLGKSKSDEVTDREGRDLSSSKKSDIDNAVEPKVRRETLKPSVEEEGSMDDRSLKFGQRARSFDSEYNTADSESWTFFKDLKGKLAKNIEECINKDVAKGLLPTEELNEPSLMENSADTTIQTTFDPGVDDHISPSIEATENLDESLLSDSNDQIQIMKSSKQTPSTSTSKYTTELLTKRKAALKPDFNMKLSTLIALRSFSSEEEKTESSHSTQHLPSEETAVIPSDTTTPDNISTPGTSSKNLKSEFSKIFLLIRSFYPFIKSSWNKNIAYVVVALISCQLLPIPSAVCWFFIGTILSALVMYWIMKPAAKKEPLKMPDYKNLPPLAVPLADVTAESAVYMGWMNELPHEYNPDAYHVNSTHSVYIRLDGSSLRVSNPVSNIPKRAMFNERRHELASLYPRHHDITGASVELLPEGLPKKRLWSKKYPICLKLIDQRLVNAKEFASSDIRPSKPQTSKESSPSKKYEPKVSENGEVVLYLFSRTDREKDDWYRRFQKASRNRMMRSHSPLSSPNIAAALDSSLSENKRAVSVDLGSLQSSSSLANIPSFEEPFDEGDDDAFAEVNFDKQLQFEYYMTQLLPKAMMDPTIGKKMTSGREKVEILDAKSPIKKGQDFLWLNTLIGRMFFDFLTEDVWADVIAERIQRKLSKIKLPNFIEELKITDKNLGTSLPKIHRTSAPVVDQRGIWVDIDISYNGCFQMTLETKLNLLRLQRSGDYPFSAETIEKELKDMTSRSHVYDSEEEDSAESSSDDDVPMPEMNLASTYEESSSAASSSTGSASSGGSTGKKLIRLVDKIAQSSYFQSAAKNKFFKRAMVEVSNTPLVLTVEIQCLTGTLALNIPPMPTDRLWYGFRKNPELCIQARPKLGCHKVRMSHVIDWIEKKLVLEFQKVLVMPNMDDLVIPIMHSDV